MPSQFLQEMNYLSNQNISLIKTVQHRCHVTYISPIEVLLGIRDGNWQQEIEEVRNLLPTDPEKAKALKKQLPALMFSGKFGGQKAADFKEHSGVICFDYDEVGEEAMGKFQQEIKLIPSALAYFKSPSNNGLKVLIAVTAKNPTEHKICWEIGKNILDPDNLYPADEAPKNVSAKCFVSFDPSMWFAPAMSQVTPIGPNPTHPLALLTVKSVKSVNSVNSVNSEHSTFQTSDSWKIREKAEEELSKLPSPLNGIWKRYLDTRSAIPRERHIFLKNIITAMHEVVSLNVLNRLLLLHYDLHYGTWSTPKNEHRKEIQDIFIWWEDHYSQTILNPTERKKYLEMPFGNTREVFRICRGLAGAKEGEKGRFFLSHEELGGRIGIPHGGTTKRIFENFQAEGIIRLRAKGRPRAKGHQSKASTWDWLLDEEVRGIQPKGLSFNDKINSMLNSFDGIIIGEPPPAH